MVAVARGFDIPDGHATRLDEWTPVFILLKRRMLLTASELDRWNVQLCGNKHFASAHFVRDFHRARNQAQITDELS